MKKIILSSLVLFLLSATYTYLFAEGVYVRSNATTAKTGIKIHYDVPIIQIDVENVAVVTADSLVFDIDNIFGYNMDFKISSISSGSVPTTANISYRSLTGTEYESTTLTTGTHIENIKSSYIRFTIPILNAAPRTITGNVRFYP